MGGVRGYVEHYVLEVLFRVVNMPNRAASFYWENIQYMVLLTAYLALIGQSRKCRQF